MLQLPRLFKIDTKGKYRVYDIQIEPEHGYYKVIFGVENGKMQEAITKCQPKNIGKSNETSLYDQTIKEASAFYENQIKYNDYYLNKNECKEVKCEYTPMLAHNYADHKDKLRSPCLAQPKFDGIRCIAVIENNTCKLFTRSGIEITSCIHIQDELLQMHQTSNYFADQKLILDGELYNHDLKNDFEKIVSAVRSEYPNENSHLIQYHIYDLVHLQHPQEHRSSLLSLIPTTTFIKPVWGWYITRDIIDQVHADFVKLGYEGVIFRNLDGLYEQKRSTNLLKYKKFDELEFIIKDVIEGKGKLMGHGIFVCETEDGQLFQVKCNGELNKLREYWEYKEKFIGKLLTVQFQGRSSGNKIPRFPVGKTIRDYE